MGECYWPQPFDLVAQHFTFLTRFAQTFTPLWSHSIEFIRVVLAADSFDTTIKVALQYLDVDGKPDGNDVASILINSRDLTPFFFSHTLQLPFPPIRLVTTFQYALVFSVISATPPKTATLYFVPPPGGYSRGKMIRSITAGQTWNLADLGDIAFSEFGDPPLHATPYNPPIENWSPTSISKQDYYVNACIRVTTTEPVRLTCHITDTEPTAVETFQDRRGTQILCLDHYSFITRAVYQQHEQLESLYHTFYIGGLKKDRPYWLVYTAQADWQISNSTSPIFKYVHPEALPFTTIRRPDAPGDVCRIPREKGAPCPNHWENVDEATPDDEETWVSSRTYYSASFTDLYSIPPLDPLDTAPIEKVHITARFKRSPAMPHIRAYAHIRLKTHGVEYSSSSFITEIDWHNEHWHVTTNPFTGLPWTREEIADLQIGIRLMRRQGVGWGITTYCTQIYCTIHHQCGAYE